MAPGALPLIAACSCAPSVAAALLPTSATRLLYLSRMSVYLSTPYCLKKLFRRSLPPACIFFSCSADQASMVTDLQQYMTTCQAWAG
jgi:hypothetical protein